MNCSLILSHITLKRVMDFYRRNVIITVFIDIQTDLHIQRNIVWIELTGNRYVTLIVSRDWIILGRKNVLVHLPASLAIMANTIIMIQTK